MKKVISLVLFAIIPIVAGAQVSAQHPEPSPALKVQKFVLDNGFTVYLNEDKTAKEVFGAVVVKAGSKNDPADATGIAHYLEHLMFKGTTEMGTTNYALEKPYLDSISAYYELLGKTKDDSARKKLQMLINRQSVEASKYALPTEFDKLVKSIGGTGLNAYTSMDMTVFLNGFPGEQMDKWLELYSERFQHPVFRSFQSELEVVYEEKNRAMDNFYNILFEDLNANLFHYHPYGTQTTLGTVEHLKNPSLTKMYDFVNTYYVANNMALVLCGNFDAQKALPIIRAKFSKLRTGIVPSFPKYPETVFTQKEIKQVSYSPVKVEMMGFKTGPNSNPDKATLEVFTNLLSNQSHTGKVDLLKVDGKLVQAEAFTYSFNDDGAVILYVVPKAFGQSFDTAEKLVMDEINKVKKGELSDNELIILKTGLYRQRQQELEKYDSRAERIAYAFAEGKSWEEALDYSQQLQSVTKEDIMRVANKYFGDNYFAIRSKVGSPTKVVLQKPGFQSVAVDQKEESVYAKAFKATVKNTINPKFLDFDKDADFYTINESNSLYVTKNPINDVFTLKVEFSVGSNSLKNLDLLPIVFDQIHTKELSKEKLKEAFALLGVTYYAKCDMNRFSLNFTGLDANLHKSLPLINLLINHADLDEKGVSVMQKQVSADRKSEAKDPNTTGYALLQYAQFGNRSDYVDRISDKGLKNLKASQLLDLYAKATAYNAVWHYVGTESAQKVQSLLSSNIALTNNKSFTPLFEKENNGIIDNKVYLMDDKEAVQSQIYYLINSQACNFSPQVDSPRSAFNEYMDGGFSGLLMQEIREYRSLAYTVGGGFEYPLLRNHNGFFLGFVGTQADKTTEAVEVMSGLLTDMPQKPERIEAIKSTLKNSITARYPDFRNISSTIEEQRQRGFTSDPLIADYALYDGLTFDNINSFFLSYIKSKPIVITVLGNKKKMDLVKLAKYGMIQEVTSKEVLTK